MAAKESTRVRKPNWKPRRYVAPEFHEDDYQLGQETDPLLTMRDRAVRISALTSLDPDAAGRELERLVAAAWRRGVWRGSAATCAALGLP